MKNLCIFGGSGNRGTLIVNTAVERGYRVTAFCRDSSSAQFPKEVTVVKGDLQDRNAVTSQSKVPMPSSTLSDSVREKGKFSALRR